MRYFYVLLACIMLFSGTAHAQTSISDSHQTAALGLLNISGLEKQLNLTTDVLLQGQLSAMQNTGLPCVDQLKAPLKAFLNKHLSYAAMKPFLIETYAQTFNETELNEITAFYKTPTGQKALKSMPELANKGAAYSMQIMQNNQAEMMSMIKNVAQQCEAKN